MAWYRRGALPFFAGWRYLSWHAVIMTQQSDIFRQHRRLADARSPGRLHWLDHGSLFADAALGRAMEPLAVTWRVVGWSSHARCGGWRLR